MKRLILLCLVFTVFSISLSAADNKGDKPEFIVMDKASVDVGNIKLKIEIDYAGIINEHFLPSTSHLLGSPVEEHPWNLVDIKLKNTGRKKVNLLLKARLQGFSPWTKNTVSISAGKTKVVGLTPSFGEKLSTLKEHRPGDIEWSVETLDGKFLAGKTKRIVLASCNEIMIADAESAAFLPVFVTPNDPVVDEVLTAAQKLKYIKAFDGYQSEDPDQVFAQVKAIYDTLARLGVKYRSATKSYLDTVELESQKVFFPRQSLNLTSANCIDGTVLMASCLEKIELDPLIVLVPGHAFLGVILDQSDDPSILFVECTMIGEGKKGKSNFEKACDEAGASYDEAANEETVDLIDVAALREEGILPYPYYEKLTAKHVSVLKRLGLVK
ncbi:MAG: hypothetical protein ACYTFY_12835 [Planctomycetota bacterium]